jgi:hypothetical protein
VNTRGQLAAFGGFLAALAVLTFLSYALFLHQIAPAGSLSPQVAAVPPWVLGLANAGIVVVSYGLLGLAGLWFARRLRLPGTYREGTGEPSERRGARWWPLCFQPLLLGLVLGSALVALDRLFRAAGAGPGLPHPAFPLSLFASATAAIGEEILFRSFVLGLWAFLFNLVLRRWGRTPLALWAGIVIAALAFGAAHLPTLMQLTGARSLSAMGPLLVAEVFLLNGVVGAVAGERTIRNGLVAAVGIHFWTDIVWHVLWPTLAR